MKKKAPQDSTIRNVQSANKRIKALEDRVRVVEVWVKSARLLITTVETNEKRKREIRKD